MLTAEQCVILIVGGLALALMLIAMAYCLAHNPYTYTESFDEYRYRMSLACNNRAGHPAHGHCIGVPPVVWYSTEKGFH